MRLPDFLIIGAMNSGTTSLFYDLAASPGVFVPDTKEPNSLATDEVCTGEGTSRYARLFRKAGRHQVCGEASTIYSKLPDVPGVPERALRVLGEQLKVIYLVREPVARTVSQHYHELAEGAVDPNIDRAVLSCSRLIDYSRYAYQIRPWLDRFGRDQVRIVRFETFVAQRVATVEALWRFLGVEASAPIDVDRVFNPAERKLARQGPMWRWSRGAVYQTWIRPWLPQSLRRRFKRLLLRRAPPRPAPPSLDTVDHILERVRDDVAGIQEILGADEPLWDLEGARRRFSRISDPVKPAR